MLVLIPVDEFLAMSQRAVASARLAWLTSMADRGNHGAVTAMGLAEDPGRFLSALRIGITLVMTPGHELERADLANPLRPCRTGSGRRAAPDGPSGSGRRVCGAPPGLS